MNIMQSFKDVMANESVQKTLDNNIYWKAAIFKASNGWFMACALAYIGATDGMPEHRTARLILIVLTAGSKYLDGFLDQTINNLKTAQNPLGLDKKD